jgi:hypothetical protein
MNPLMKKLSAMLAEKREKPYAEVCGYVTARMSIAIVRATHRCLSGSQVPTGKMSEKLFPQWEDRAGLSLYSINTVDHPPDSINNSPPISQTITQNILLSVTQNTSQTPL